MNNEMYLTHEVWVDLNKICDCPSKDAAHRVAEALKESGKIDVVIKTKDAILQ